MSPRLLRLLSALALATLLVVTLLPRASASAPAAGTSPRRIYMPLMLGGDAAIPTGFVEVEGARSAYGRVFVGAVGGRTVARYHRYAEPADYYDTTSRSWQPIDTRIISQTDGSYRNAAAGFTARFSTEQSTALHAGTTPLVQLGRLGQPTIALSLLSGTLPSPLVATDTITYSGVAAQSDLIYRVHPWGLKEELVLHGAGAPARFELSLRATGVTATRQPDASWLLTDVQKRTLWRVLPPFGADAKGAAAPLTLEITPQNGELRVVLAVDPAWLAAPGRAFPVRLDPSLADPQYMFSESYVQSTAPDLASYSQRNRFIGHSTYVGNKGITRLFAPVDLSFLPAGLTPAQLLAARLVFTQYVSESGPGGFDSSVYALQSPWNNVSLTWNNQPTPSTLVAGGVHVSPALEQKRWDITAWARQVLAGTATNNGVMIRADDETSGGGIFWSSGCTGICPNPLTDRPYLEVQVALDSGLNPALDTWGFPNREGLPSFEQFAADYGVPTTTHLVTETRVLEVISPTDTFSIPVSFAPADINLTLPLNITGNLSPTDPFNGDWQLVPRPISYAYEEVIVKAVYDDQFSEYYASALKGGLCMGMAATIADFYRLGGPAPSAYGGATTVRSIPDGPLAQNFIQAYHGRQVGSQVLNWLATQGRFSAVDYYNRIVGRIGGAAWKENPEIVGILKGSNCEDVEIGHALLPYKVVPQPGSLARVYVYDPNYPPTSADDSANRYIEIDLAANTWSYELAPGIIWTGGSLYTTPLSLLREKPIQPTQSDTDILMVEGGHSAAYGGHSVAYGGHSAAYGGHSAAYGDGTYTGCIIEEDGQPTFVQEISRTMRLTPLTGGLRDTQTFPDTLFFPAGQDWTFTGTGSRTGGIGDVMLFGPHGLAGVLSTATGTTRDHAAIDAAFRALTVSTDDASKPLTAYQMHETDRWTRIYAVSNTILGAGEELKLVVSPDLGQLIVINDAAVAKQFDLGLGQVGSDGIGQIVYPQQPIGPGERRIYTPIDWRNLPGSPIKVEIDVNNDGVIDRTELLGGDYFPAVTALTGVPTQPGQQFAIITHEQIDNGHRGWVNLDQPLAPGAVPTNTMQGSEAELRRWLRDGGNAKVTIGSGLVGISGTHGGLFEKIGTPHPGEEDLYKVGAVMIVPIYDQVIPHQGSQPLFYRVGGYAVVKIVSSSNGGGEDAACTVDGGCRKSVVAELIARIVP